MRRLHLRRRHLFELEDQPWFPKLLRDCTTEYLRFFERLAGVPDLVLPHLRRLLAAAPTPGARIVDLCSGAGGPAVEVGRRLAPSGVRVLLTDRYPNLAAMRRIEARTGGAVQGVRLSVDARAVPPELNGVRTVFTAFHHFRPLDARRILAAAAAARTPIAVFEFAERRATTIALVLPVTLLQVLTAPLLRPWRWSRVLLTYLLPVLPFVTLFDGVVSCLRAYDLEELASLSAGLGGEDWTWKIGRERLRRTPGHLTYLLGLPQPMAVH